MRTKLLAFTLLAGCVQPAPETMQNALDGATHSGGTMGALMADLVSQPSSFASFRVIYPPPPVCEATRPHPFLVAGFDPNDTREVPRYAGPIAGQEFHAVWWTSAMPDPTDNCAAWLCVGSSLLNPPVRLPTLAGCWALVASSQQVGIPVAPGWQGGVLRDPSSPGRIELKWKPPAASVGSTVYLQLLIYKPGVTSTGFDVSPALELTVGNQ